jgi:uncharacterized repeat protein (TIGR04052 family)
MHSPSPRSLPALHLARVRTHTLQLLPKSAWGPLLVCLLSVGASACDDGESPPADAGLDSGDELGDGGPDAGDGDGATGDAGDDAGEDPDAGSDEPMQVTIKFAAKVGEQPFACGGEYEDVGSTGVLVTPEDLRLFVQDVALLRTEDGQEVPVTLDVGSDWQESGTALLDFEDASGKCAGSGSAATNLVVTGTVPRGEYSGLAFTQGVPEAVNHLDPLGFEGPLTNIVLHWGWQGGYLFLRSGLAEVVDQGMAGGSSLVHMGSTACTAKPPAFSCDNSNRARVVLPDFDVESSTVIVDVAELYAGVDLSMKSMCHGMGAGCSPFFEALGIDAEDGSARETQSVYRAE